MQRVKFMRYKSYQICLFRASYYEAMINQFRLCFKDASAVSLNLGVYQSIVEWSINALYLYFNFTSLVGEYKKIEPSDINILSARFHL